VSASAIEINLTRYSCYNLAGMPRRPPLDIRGATDPYPCFPEHPRPRRPTSADLRIEHALTTTRSAPTHVAPVQKLGVRPDKAERGMGVFARIIVGVDGTDWGFETLRQALLLAPEATSTVSAVQRCGSSCRVNHDFHVRLCVTCHPND
jgi:hypothetical protein